jgi:hypothetical protein
MAVTANSQLEPLVVRRSSPAGGCVDKASLRARSAMVAASVSGVEGCGLKREMGMSMSWRRQA